MNKNKRPQTPKQHAALTGRNEDYMRGMQEIRRSNAAQPIPSGTRYTRKTKHRTRQFDY